MKIKKSDLLNKKEKNFIEVEQGSNKIKIDDLLSNKEISVTRKPGAKEAEDAYRNFVINKSYGANVPVANTQTVKPQVNINAPVMNTQPVNKPVTQPVARPVIDPLDEDALRINMANNRTEPTAIMKAASFVGKNLYNNIVKPAGQAIDRQYEKLDDYNFGEKALYDAYMISQENSQNAWDEETLRLQRLKNDYDKLLSYMTPEQKLQYSRIPENERKDYLDSIMAQLQSSKGAARAEEIRNIQDKTNQNLQKIGLSFESGMGGFKTGLKGAYNLMRGADETVAKNASEYAFDELRPETKGALGVAMDLSNTVGNMAPSIALGLVGGPLGVGALGTAAMGVSSAGKGYDSAIGEGYTPEQAAAYGIASGVSEALLQKIAGALPGVSNAQGLVTRFLGKYGDDVLSKVVSNPSLRKALVTLLGNAASEGSEEGAQEIIDTFIRNAVLGEDKNINWKDVGYSALLGGMTGGAFALPGGVSTVVNRDSSIDTAQPAPETTQPTPEAVENTADAVQNDVEMPEEVTEENTAAETEPVAEVEEEVIESKPITDAVKRTVKAVNPNAENSQQIYRQIMANNGFGDLVNRMDTIARRLGSEVQYYADDTRVEGYNLNHKIYLNINNIRDTADAEWKLFKHELTHSLEGTDAYKKLLTSRAGVELFNKFLIDKGYTVTDEKGNVSASLDALANEISELYRRNDVELDPQDLEHEMVARFIEESDLFENEESIRRLAQESPDFVQRILRWIKDTIANIGADADTRNLRNAERMFERALDEVVWFKRTLDQVEKFKRALDQVVKGEYKNSGMGKQYSFSTDSNGRQLTPEQQEYFKDSKAVDKEGRLLALYHQTENEFTVFDTKHKGAGTSDSGTPFGIFLKSTNSDIGLRGKNQMALYADIKNPLTANNRDELTRKLKFLSPEYDAITEKHKMLDTEYKEKFETAKRDFTNFIVEWRKNNPDASRTALYDVPEFNKLFEAEDILVKEWGEKADALSVEAKEILTQTLRDNGYDGVILKNDAGSFGRSTDAYIALDPQQVKNIDNAKPTNNPDIRYSFKDDGNLTKKAESYLHRNTNTLLNDFLEITETDKFADARTLKRDINTFAEASVRNGEVDRAEAEKLFDTLYWDALKVNTDVYDKYRPLAEKIKNTKLYGGGLGSLEGEYRRKYFNKVRLVTDPSATKIDGLYKELSESYPELFDPEITNIEDQVPAMAAAIDYIYNRETKLVDIVKHNDERYNVAKEEFMKSLDKFEQGIGDVIRYNDSKETREAEKAAIKAERKENAEKIPIDRQFTKKFYEDLTAAERKYEWLAKKEMLTPDDTSIMRQLSEGTIKWDEVERRADEFNINAIKKVYDAYNTKHQLELTEQEHRNDVLRERREEAESSISDSDSWKDKPAGAMYARETMERNIEDITKKGNNNNRRNEDAYWINKTYFKPVHENEAKSNRLKKELGDRVRALKLGTKPMYTVMIRNEYTGLPAQTEVSESGLVQLYGEGLINDTTLDRLGADKEKIHKAVNEFRGIYNQLIEMANETLIRNGYRPVGYIKNYFPHFTENKPDSTLGKIAAYFGIEIRADELPTDIAGLTHTFRPGKKWVSNFLRRRTNITDYDALKGFDRYINGVADVIFHTDDIQRLRALESAIRYKYSDEGTKKRIKEIERIKTLTAEERISRINDIIKANEVSHLPNFVTQLRNYTDNLAGKKSMSDRNWEHAMGRGLYNFTKKMENRVSANMVALNPGSWLTNFIPITQVSGIVKAENLARAIWDTSKGAAKKDGFSDRSDFLVNRKGSDTTFKTTTDKVQEKLTKPFEMIDSFTAEIVTRALYYDKMAEVKNEAEALEYANEMAARVMADRSKGAKPTAFNAQNPVAKLFTMFQVEVNNQYSYMFKDVPADLRKKGLESLAWAFVKMFLGAYLYNEVYEKIIGRRAAFDPVDIMASAIGDFTNPDVKKSQAVANTAANVVDELPFVSGILGGGRVPISSALPSVSKLNEAGVGLISGEMNSKKAAQQLGKELIKPAAYLVPPVGGGQIKKAIEGISTVAKGGEVTYDNEGNEILKYPIEDKTPLKYLQAGLFGKSSLKESQDYYNNGMPTLTVKQTQNYHKAVEAGINYNQYMAALQASKGAESDKDKDGKTIALSLAKNKKAAIDEAVKEFNLSKKQKELLYEANDVSEKVW